MAGIFLGLCELESEKFTIRVLNIWFWLQRIWRKWVDLYRERWGFEIEGERGI